MKFKIAIVVLCLVCLGLGVALVLKHQRVVEVQQKSENQGAALASLSNEVKQTSATLDQQRDVNTALTNMVVQRETKIGELSHTVTELATKLQQTEADAKAKGDAAKVELEKREVKIKELEGMNDDMTKSLDQFTSRIGSLQKQIAETEQKLAVSQGDRAFLLKELTRLQSEKAELERQFADLKLLKAQVARLREELAIANRFAFIRAGVFSGMKGAERLMQQTPSVARLAATNFNLNVEFKQDGGARVVPVASAPAPAPK